MSGFELHSPKAFLPCAAWMDEYVLDPLEGEEQMAFRFDILTKTCIGLNV